MAAKSRYDLQNRVEIGRGAFGRVYKVKDNITNKFVAMKSVSNFQSNKQEIQLLKECKSPYIVEFIGVMEQDFSTLIVMEYCNAGSLMDILKYRKSMNEMELNKIMKDVLNGLDFLHNTKNILHRDVKPDNILLGDDGHYKLSDFGVSKNINISSAKTKAGTPLYMAPELLMFKKYDNKCDIWSVGVTGIHLFVYKDPLIEQDVQPIRQIIDNINLLPTKNECFRNFIKKCIVKVSNNRASVDQLLKSDAFINNANGYSSSNNDVPDSEEKKICIHCNGQKIIQKEIEQQTKSTCGNCNGNGNNPLQYTGQCQTCNAVGYLCNRCNAPMDPYKASIFKTEYYCSNDIVYDNSYSCGRHTHGVFRGSGDNVRYVTDHHACHNCRGKCIKCGGTGQIIKNEIQYTTVECTNCN